MAASLVRLHFHDCFVKGCDASVLLDSSPSIVSEKLSNPNRNSIRGFDVVDEIKAALERECPSTVSCADILALAARDSTVLTGGPNWEVPLGRRDSRSASLSGSNNNIPAPTTPSPPSSPSSSSRASTSSTSSPSQVGSHTIGMSRCTSFRQRLYNQTGNGLADFTLDASYAAQLRTRPAGFDNSYFRNILAARGLLSSDQVLYTRSAATRRLVRLYARNNAHFLRQFARSMIKMSAISPLTGARGEIRRNCRRVNNS
ncbi:unnamed protein product [Spirodela intermedia]|nr:unnamed protein product [Spirodela intermedia]CAA6673051.1 unnamed protein product [Spirodela intermedia]